MQSSNDAAARERCSFQRKLDEVFPLGAMCAMLEDIDGRLQATGLLGTTGRLFCCDARRRSNTGPWEYQVLIDPRRSQKPAPECVRAWITGVIRNTAVQGLWEADVVDTSGDRHRLLRLNANPPAHLRPSKRMRTAVTKAHEATLFPNGLASGPHSPALID